jgi:hypothetical protein
MRKSTPVQHSRIPLGCTDQGRHPEAAEPCTEFNDYEFKDAARFVVWQIVIAIVIVGVIAGIAVLL